MTARIPTVEPPYDAEVGAQLEAMMPAGVPPIALFRTFVRNLPMAAAMHGWGSYVLGRRLSVSMRAREIVIDRATARCGGEYEWGVHVAFFAERVGLTGEQVRSLTHGGPRDGCWTDDADAVVVELVDQLHDTNDIDDGLWGRLERHFSHEQLLDLIVLCGWYHAIAWVARAARVEPESFAPTFAAVANLRSASARAAEPSRCEAGGRRWVMPPAVHIVAVVAYEGVLADETAAFIDVLGRLPGARVVIVGSEVGVVGGPGGAERIEARFDEVDPDVVVVPGGLGSHRHREIAIWIRRVRPRWVLTSSTGSALLAAGGLLRGRRAATHWLAGPLLERYGAIPAGDRLVIDGPFVTCAGLATTFEAADVVVRTIGGDELVQRIHQDMRTDALFEPPACSTARTRYRARGRRSVGIRVEPPPEQWGGRVEVELEEHDDPSPPRR